MLVVGLIYDCLGGSITGCGSSSLESSSLKKSFMMDWKRYWLLCLRGVITFSGSGNDLGYGTDYMQSAYDNL